ncbi:hypothetical protein GGR06_003840 [Bacteroides reticulotermitis]|nr:type II CAAX endopeptidase family protein [Bacteroides reticulotermitis]MBB4046014.1 hypothetical protein [Bacteroides reticulotermitis]HJD74471.1 CPBP family intramembrane metalloprotease [Bacteroides reticulotermitis]
MRTVIKLLLIYLLISQIIAPILMLIPAVIYVLATTGNLDRVILMQMVLLPSLLAGQLMMGIYLWKAGYIGKQKATWSPVSVAHLFYSILAILSSGFLVTVLLSYLKWIPDLLEQTFDFLQSGWVGIVTIALVGPVFEEILFRGAITKVLLERYSPGKAILFSALVFGIFHLNPAQIIPAFLIGLLFAWTYYKTRSLIPCIVMHVVNNSFSVYTNIQYPEFKYIDDLFAQISNNSFLFYLGSIVVASLILLSSILHMRRTAKTYQEEQEA